MRTAMPLALVFALAISCSSPVMPDAPTGATTVVGTVHYYTVEGGFWAVRGDDGVIYDPLGGLPAAFQRENLRVRATVRVRQDLASTHMVGPIVEIVSIVPI
jgi:hypothetical protein